MNILTDYAIDRCTTFGLNTMLSDLNRATLFEMEWAYSRFAVRAVSITDRLSNETLIHYTSITGSWTSKTYLLKSLGVSR